MRSTTVAIACATLCTAACVATVRADIVHFVNPAPGQPGHYDWSVQLWEMKYLDISLPAAEQTSTGSGNSLLQYYLLEYMPGSGSPPVHTGVVYGPAMVAVDHIEENLLPLLAGDHLDGQNWMDAAYFAWGSPQTHSPFPEGERRYIGVQISGGRFGWIEVERTGLSFAAYSWAYETVPGVPILAGQVPTPGAAVLMVAGALGAATRRRRP
ncbi:MAG: hypothetical protein KF864_00075 [Phycisphaeraceae bacterium]|nr:hypothetical protein [Phycisphaeraceae bacterium]